MSGPFGSTPMMFASGSTSAAGGVQQSLKFNDDESQYLSWTPAAAGNRKTWTWSGWVKLGNISIDRDIFTAAGSGTQLFECQITSGNTIQVWANSQVVLNTTQVLRDTSAWYHLMYVSDTTQATASDRFKIYLNGVEITAFATDNRSGYSQNFDGGINSTVAHYIGQNQASGNRFDGYLSDVYFIDGQALDPTSFGQFTNGYWEAKDYAGSYGTNGFHLTFQDDVVSEGFNTATYAGTSTNPQSISGLGFAPDLVWLKARNQTYEHILFDTIRGSGKRLFSHLTNAESTNPNTLSSFDADGFTVGTPIGADLSVNGSGNSYVAWNWDAGENNASTGHSSVTYTGNGGTQSIKGFGFEPDLVWLKGRSYAEHHHLYDTIRGATEVLYSNRTVAEASDTLGLTSFDSDGFSIGSRHEINNSGDSFVAWGWDAGSGSPVSNTDGSITSTVKANPATGFSIVSYTGNATAGATVGHGLGSDVKAILCKQRDGSTYAWNSWHVGLSNDHYIQLNTSSAEDNSAFVWDTSGMTSSVFTHGAAGSVMNFSGNSYIAYCFAEVAGYSSIGSYTGNGSSSGPTINCGFRPGFILVKRTDSSGFSWVIWDATRNPLGDFDDFLQPQDSAAEANNGTTKVTPSSTGFQVTGTHTSVNASGGTYIYMAFKGSYSDYVSDVNTDGTIDSRVKANPDYGFSITSYVGTGVDGDTVGHGLTASAPELVIIKGRTGAGYPWAVYGYPNNPAFPNDGSVLYLNDSAAMTDSTGSELSLGASTITFVDSGANINGSGQDYICYAFHSVAGYSSIGSYTGTGSAGNAVTGLGFKPAWLMVKRTDAATTYSNWWIQDATRNPTNVGNTLNLAADNSNAETNALEIDFDSDGFTLQDGSQGSNISGATYIYMAFADTREAAFWKDVSGQGNHWTPNNLDYRDSLIDSPANNFATFNAVDRKAGGTLSEGNLGYNHNSNTYPIRSTFSQNSGKWFWEVRASGNGAEQGLALAAGNLSGTYATYNLARISFFNGNKRIGSGSLTSYDTGGAASAGDVYGFAADLDNGDLTVYRNGTSLGSLHTWTPDETYYAPHMDYSTTSSGVDIANFGQDSTFSGTRPAGGNTDANGIGDFAYAPPAGYLALCAANLPTPSIVDGSEYFNTVLYTGNASTNAVTGVGFDLSADGGLVWMKNRASAYFHGLYDSVRGTGITKSLYSNATDAEGANSANQNLVSFDSDGFTLGSTTGTNAINTSGQSHVAWNWKAGGTAVSNTDGSITSQVSAGEYMSICTWTGNGTSGATIGHGLNKIPSMLIVKRRNTANGWPVYHEALGTGSEVYLNYTQGTTSSNFWITSPTSSVFSVSNSDYVNTSSDTYVGYAFANLDGACKVGSYTGNGSSDGPFVYTGFEVSWVMAKRTDSADSWCIWDIKRTDSNGGNVIDKHLRPDSSSAESDPGGSPAVQIDALSNGFKLRESNGQVNASGGTYIFLAFAKNPFKYANAR